MCSTSTGSTLIRYFCLICFLISSSSATAQIDQTTRYELFLSPADHGNFEVLSAGQHGLILNRRFSFPDDDRIELIKLDTAFKENWRGFLSIEKRLNLISKRMVGEKLYLLFRDRDLPKKSFFIYTIMIENGTFFMNEMRNVIPFAPIEFQITDQAAIVGGYFNTVPVVMYFSFHDQKTKIVPGLQNETGELTQIRTYPDASFDVLISAKDNTGTKTIWIKNYNAEGNLVRNLPLTTDPDKHLIFARSLKMDSESQLVAGVYGRKFSSYSKGIFISRIDPTGYQEIKYYNYGDLRNFFKYMKAKRERRIQDRILRRKVLGKKIRFNYRFMVHEVVPHNDQFIMLGEAFYPEYTTAGGFSGSFFRPSYYTNSIVREGRIFDGYRYTHAVVIGFDQNGNVIWDNSFEINDVKTFTLEQFVKLEIKDDKITLLYLYENALRTKVIQGNNVVEGKNIAPLKKGGTEKTGSSHEKITMAKLDYWYPNTFYASGITEQYSSGGGVRRVFFINKITGTLPEADTLGQKDVAR